MAWKKIDDDQTLADMPYSAFLANGLTTNVNSYNQQLTRGGGIAWNAHDKVTWASYFTPQGLMFTVDVGQQVTQLDFRVKYGTITASVDADGFQGSAFITHLGSGEFVEVGVLPTTGAESYFDVSMPLTTASSGPQAFSLTFRSSKLDIIGLVDVQGGVENTIYLDQRGGAGHYNITQGEKFELLSLAETGHVVGSTGPSTQDTQYYQINYIHTGDPHPPDGYASVVPSVTADPPRLSASYNGTKIGAGTVFELGAFTLYSIAYNVVSANPGSAPPQYAHNSASALAQVINIENTAMRQFQMDLCNGVSQRYALAAVVAGAVTIPTAQAAQKIRFSFSCGAADVYSELCVTFSALTLAQTNNQGIRLDLYDSAGTALYNRTQTVYAASDRTQQCVAGITARGWYDLAAVQAWGMRDSIPDSEMLAGTPQTFIIPPRTYTANQPYTIELSASPSSIAFYVYNLYARFIASWG
jgi:hypothetical protein